MYFPYLYARKFELLSLRDATEEFQLSNTVVPVLEPVKAASGDLVRCMRILGERDAQMVIITNPHQGDFRNSVPDLWRTAIDPLFAQHANLLPGFLCRQTTTAAQIRTFLARFPDRDIAVLYWSPQLTDPQMAALVAEQRIRFHINLHDRMSAAQRQLLPRGKAVDVRDNFHALERNADYNGAEFFTDRHLTFAQNAVGYGDYSVVGSTFREGGGPPNAVAIHATYKQPGTGQIWVEHFVSDDVERGVGSVEGKFQQAARKLVRTVARRPAEFGNNNALRAYHADVAATHFPGLGESKRRQVLHHIAVNHLLLSGGL
jgi:hypothetical protein